MLEKKPTIDPKEIAHTYFFFGGCVFLALVLIAKIILEPDANYQLQISQLFQTSYIFRIIINFVIISFGGGICLRVWKRYQINYLHIMQISMQNNIIYIELWKIAFLFLTVFLTILTIY